MTYTVHEVSANPVEARVRYAMQLKATDPRTGKTVINVSGAQRILEWTKGFCNCPETGMSAWMLKRDAFLENITGVYLRARTDGEREFILIGLEKSALEESAAALQREGIELINSGNYQGAFKILSRAQDIHGEIKYQERLSSEIDVEDYEQRIREARATQNKPALAFFLKSAAGLYTELKENDRARSYLESSLQLFMEINDSLSAAKIYMELAQLRVKGGDYLGGLPDLQKSLDQFLAAATAGVNFDESATSDLVDVVGGLFLLYQLQGRDEDATRIVQDAQKILPDEYKALFMFGRGFFQWLRGRLPSALDNNEKAFELLGKLPRTESGEIEGGLAGVSVFLSVVSSMQGDYTKAAVNLRRARDVLRNWKLSDPEMSQFGDMPKLYVRLMEALFYETGSSEAALESSFKKMIPRISEVSELSQVQLPLGELDVPQMLYLASIEYIKRGQHERALQCLLQALALAQSSDDKTLPARIHQYLAIYYTTQENDAKVLEHLNTSLRLSEELRAPVEAAVIGRMSVGMNLMILASTYESAKNYKEARRSYQKLLELLGPFTLFNYLIHKEIAGTYYAEGKYDEAIRELDKGINLARRAGMRYSLWEMYQLSGRAHWWKNETALARRALEAAVAEIEAMRRTVVGGEVVLQRFFEDKLSPYHDLIELLIQRGDCDEAFAYAERSKSRVLQDVLKRGRKYTKRFMSSTEQEEEASLRRRLITLNRRFEEEKDRESGPGRLEATRGARAEARLDYELFRANLYVAHRELATAPVQEATKVEGLGDLLPSPDTALLEYVVTGDSTYLFVITAEADLRSANDLGGVPPLRPKCRAYPLEISGLDLEEKVSEFRIRVGHPEGVLQRQARDLYDQLLLPAQQQLAGKKTLVIVPDGVLWELPFQALKPKVDRYLLQDGVIYYAPSFIALQEMRQAKNARIAGTVSNPPSSGGKATTDARRRLTLLAVGNPLLSDGRESLQGTGELAKRIESLYGETNARIYTEAAADEERIKSEAGHYQIIHIGTHGVLDNENPMYSYVELFQGERAGENSAASLPEDVALDLSEDLSKDGFLEAWEIMDLELKAQLVVLSACETARGRVGGGEGMVGLSWALFIAGSPSTVVSQWKVDEQGTNELMYSFHESIVRGTQAPRGSAGTAAALRQASLKLMDSTEYRHPYYWAGFILIGDGSW